MTFFICSHFPFPELSLAVLALTFFWVLSLLKYLFSDTSLIKNQYFARAYWLKVFSVLFFVFPGEESTIRFVKDLTLEAPLFPQGTPTYPSSPFLDPLFHLVRILICIWTWRVHRLLSLKRKESKWGEASLNQKWTKMPEMKNEHRRPEVFILMENQGNWDPFPLLDLKSRLKMESMDHHLWLNHWKPIWMIYLHRQENEKSLLLKGHIISFGIWK